jgi:hypothetical protein
MQRRNWAAVGIGAALTGALAVGITLPAAAHTGAFFTIDFVPDDNFFSTISPVDASTAPFGEPVPFSARGIEIFNESAHALYGTEGGPVLTTWDHSTGVVGSGVAIQQPEGYFMDGMSGLDTTPDGRILSIAALWIPEDTDGAFIVEIDPATGELDLLVDLSGTDFYPSSLATDPLTGITYVFSGTQYLEVNIETGAYGELVDLLGVVEDLGFGSVDGVDFDSAGTLWFLYDGEVTRFASLDGPLSESVGAISSGEAPEVNDFNLAYDPVSAPVVPAAPQLSNTGLDASALVWGGAALLASGLAILLISRRRTA